MRTAYAHDAVLELEEGSDPAAVGAAITAALCGSWSHEGPCPLAPHHTGVVSRNGNWLQIRTLFVTDAQDEPEVRRRVTAALVTGELVADQTSRWKLLGSDASDVLPHERDHVEALAAS